MSAMHDFDDVHDFIDFISGISGIEAERHIDCCMLCNGPLRYAGIEPGWESDTFVGLRAVVICQRCGWRHEEEVCDD